MSLQSSRFDSKVQQVAQALRTSVANNLMHIDLRLDHEEAYKQMKQLLVLLGESAAVAKLDAHKQKHDHFWPARNSLQELEQSQKRADYLTQKQFAFVEGMFASKHRRLIVEGPPSCGKSFILVKTAVRRLLEARTAPSAPRILLLCHSGLLQSELRRLNALMHDTKG